VACNPIFENITEKTMQEAMRKMAIRDRAEAESLETSRRNKREAAILRAMIGPVPKKAPKTPIEIVEIDLD
jgi:hypothetical protein